jgi:lysophospholipase L1-like esterase
LRLITTLIALVGLAAAGTLPAAADRSGTVQYVALGDSYAAGQGGGTYLNSCLQTASGYPELLDAEKRIHLRANAACTGASTSEVIEEQLSALNRGTRLVTITAGAADLGLSQILATCLNEPLEVCLTAIAAARGDLAALGGSLADLYAQVAQESPNAKIVVTGYPILFTIVEGDPDAALKTAVNEATALLNLTIRQAVLVAKARGINIKYVDVTEAFTGHGIGSPDPYINASGPDAFHPNAAGYQVYAAAISAVLPAEWLDEQEQSA